MLQQLLYFQMQGRCLFHVQLFVFKDTMLCFRQGDYFTNEANFMSSFSISSDIWMGQKRHISGDIWLKGKLQSMFSLAVFDSEGISYVKVSALLC